ncbi:MAG: hypothetical protein ACFFBP_06710 [Promethearchaeota archaeon]
MESEEKEIIDTRITDHWGVDWNAMEIVRDFLHFYLKHVFLGFYIFFSGNLFSYRKKYLYG